MAPSDKIAEASIGLNNNVVCLKVALFNPILMLIKKCISPEVLNRLNQRINWAYAKRSIIIKQFSYQNASSNAKESFCSW